MTPHDEHEDAGLSLIELIVVVVIVGIISGVIVMILVNSWNTQAQVNSTSVATNEGQVFSSQVERAVRNADWISPASGDGNTLVVHTTDDQCHVFAIGGGTASMATADGDVMPTLGGPMVSGGVKAATRYFHVTGSDVTYSFQISTSAAPVTFEGTITARNDLGGTPCI